MREQIYQLVRGLILTGKIIPGEAIDEKNLAALLKVSRTPVREAVKKLSDEHLVDVVAQSGTRAAHLDRHELEQAFLIRRALETEAAAQAAARMSDEHAEMLSDITVLHARAIERKNFAEAIVHDDAFHRHIAEISNLPRLWRAVEISKGQLDRCRHMMLPLPGEGDFTLEQHRQIIRALNSKDSENARAAMARHLEVSFYNALRVLDVKPVVGEATGALHTVSAMAASPRPQQN